MPARNVPRVRGGRTRRRRGTGTFGRHVRRRNRDRIRHANPSAEPAEPRYTFMSSSSNRERVLEALTNVSTRPGQQWTLNFKSLWLIGAILREGTRTVIMHKI